MQKVFGSLDPQYKDILDMYLAKGQIDVFPKVGKMSGAYCAGNLNAETFILLNELFPTLLLIIPFPPCDAPV